MIWYIRISPNWDRNERTEKCPFLVLYKRSNLPSKGRSLITVFSKYIIRHSSFNHHFSCMRYCTWYSKQIKSIIWHCICCNLLFTNPHVVCLCTFVHIKIKIKYSLLILNENDHFVIKRHRERENLIKKTYAFNYHFRGYFERNPIFIDNTYWKALIS